MLPEDQARPKAVQEAEGLPRRARIRTRRSSRSRSKRPRTAERSEVGGGVLAVEIQHRATGRRKTSVARVRLVPGNGAITVNRRTLDEYFPNNVLKMIIKQPLLSTETAERFDIHVAVTRRRPLGPGRRDPPRHLARADRVQRGAAQASQEGRLPLARSPDEGAQEVRPARRARPVPVQQAMNDEFSVRSFRFRYSWPRTDN